MKDTKTCTKCRALRPVTDFWIDKSRKDGRQFVCIECKRPEHYAKMKDQEYLDGIDKKRCTKCKEIFSKGNFSPSSDGRDDLRSYCKNCEMEYRNSESRTVSSKKYSHSEKGRENGRRYYRRAVEDGRMKEIISRIRLANKDAIRARGIVGSAIKKKEIPPAKELSCNRCGKKAQQYHHPDYSKPLEIVPLCKPCHEFIHHY